MRITACTLCGSDEYVIDRNFSKSDGIMPVCACSECGHRFTLITENIDLEALYSEDVYQVIDNRGSVFDRIQTFEYWRVVKKAIRILRIENPVPTLLDFGSGKGKFLSLAKEQFKVHGIETSVPRASFARKFYDLTIDTNYYQGGQLDQGPFDVICMFHVLEHLDKPIDLVRSLVKENLKKGGLLILEVPNLGSWQATIAGADWMHLDIPRHTSHFTAKILTQRLLELGLKVVKSDHYSFHLGILGMLRSFLGLFGYNKNIIDELKRMRSKPIHKKFMLAMIILLLLPLSVITELVASIMQKGGIMRFYLRF